ncbi:hypothetical protein EV182_005669, partial [Spiromyces aspiralis]
HQNIPILRKPFVRMFSRSWDYLKELTLPAISDEDAELIAIHTPVLIRWSFTVLRDLDLSYSELSVPAIQALLMECRRLLVLSVRVNTSMYNLPPTVVTASAVPPHVLGADDGDVYLPTNVTGWVVHRQLRNLKIQLSGIHTSITMAAMLSHFPRLEKCRVEVTDQTGWLLEPFLSRFPHIKFSTTKYHSEAWATIPDW